MTDEVTMVCEECGKSISFPARRRGHVETCPCCFNYVDVPEGAAGPVVAQPGAAVAEPLPDPAFGRPPRSMARGPRSTAQLWLEVLAVLSLSYLPWMYGNVIGIFLPGPAVDSMVYRESWHIMAAIRISLPLLLIMALVGEPWARFGIVRPKWISDALLGCVIWFSLLVAHYLVASLLPAAMLARLSAARLADETPPEGVAGWLLLLVAFAAGAFGAGIGDARLPDSTLGTPASLDVGSRLRYSRAVCQLPPVPGTGSGGLACRGGAGLRDVVLLAAAALAALFGTRR